MSKSAQKELEEFLAALPAYRRKEFQQGLGSLTQDELSLWFRDEEKSSGLREEYERLLRREPAEWRKYRAREIEDFASIRSSQLPANPKGHPRKDALAQEAAQLKNSGLSYAQIAIQLNRRHGEGTTTRERIRGLLKYRRLPKSRKGGSPPEKT